MMVEVLLANGSGLSSDALALRVWCLLFGRSAGYWCFALLRLYSSIAFCLWAEAME